MSSVKSDFEKVEERENYFYGWYKGYEFEFHRETNSEEWYIRVWDDMGYRYDGYFDDSVDVDIEDVIKESLKGSEL